MYNRIHSLNRLRAIHSLAQKNQAWLFVDSVFPLKLGIWDPRYYFGKLRQEHLLDTFSERISEVHTHGFNPISIEPHVKDGGIFVLFEYIPSQSKDILQDIQADLRSHFKSKGGVPSSTGIRRGNIWVVRGQPWREDMNRFASPLLRVSFDGPDPDEESLYQTFRPYGRIIDISAPAPLPSTAYRASTIAFSDIRSSVVARNVAHGHYIGQTRLRISFFPPIRVHLIRDWIAKHPRIFFPVIFFLLGTLTYTIFDPIRVLMVEGKILDWFDYRESRLYQWLRRNTVDRLTIKPLDAADVDAEAASQELHEAEVALRSYLHDIPMNIAFLYGPQGSGKSKMLSRLLRDKKCPVLIIDCTELVRTNSDTHLIRALSRQTGYWPVFTFLNSMSNLIDVASVGLIGQKASLSSSLLDQVNQILEVVGTALRSVSSACRKEVLHKHESAIRAEEEVLDTARIQERIRRGVWHDPRLGAIAGGGIIAELGLCNPAIETDVSSLPRARREHNDSLDLQAASALPIVEVMDAFAKWAAALVEGQTAHVVVLSHNRENLKPLAKALPTKPLTMIPLSDADNASALQFIKAQLHEEGVDIEFSHDERAIINYLGGRASDVTTLIYKVRAGQKPTDAVEDIIRQSVSELRKRAFGDDADDARSLPWTREQAWAVLRALARRDTVSYYETLMNACFKGEEAEMIAVDTQDGRPSMIRPGRPIYHYVSSGSLMVYPIFQANQDLATNTKLIESAEATVRACEQELQVLRMIGLDSVHWWSSATAPQIRAKYLTQRMANAQATLEKVEKQNKVLRKVLAESG
ncbi:RNA12 protein-domain-containing protein [Lactifluus volemus]|nr:RNA12 protein-domain-containing protein [Lactifluus volemus]